MITTCTVCSKLFEAGSEEQAYEPGWARDANDVAPVMSKDAFFEQE